HDLLGDDQDVTVDETAGVLAGGLDDDRREIVTGAYFVDSGETEDAQLTHRDTSVVPAGPGSGAGAGSRAVASEASPRTMRARDSATPGSAMIVRVTMGLTPSAATTSARSASA